MRSRLLPRLLVLVIVAVTGLGVVPPSWACGCGALVTSTDSGVSVAEETSIVRYDGVREEIVMRLSVRSRARDAAWLMPTPARATVALGESTWFDQLDRLTEPRVVRHRKWLPDFGGAGNMSGAPAPGAASGVGVLASQRLGPFQVTTLSAGDPKALAAWLRSHGYPMKGRLADALKPYVAEHWTYTAIKLAPEKGTLTGSLDPLRIAFPARSLTGDLRPKYIADTPYRQVEDEDELVTFLGIPAFLWFLAVPVVLVAAAAVILVRRSARVRRGSAAASP